MPRFCCATTAPFKKSLAKPLVLSYVRATCWNTLAVSNPAGEDRLTAAEGHVPITAMIICVLTTLILLRKLEAIGKLSVLLWVGVMGTLAIVIVAGLPHLKLEAFAFWRAPRLDGATPYAGLGVALIYAAARRGNLYER